MKNTSLRFLLLFVLLVVFGFLGFRWLQVSDSKSYPESLPVQIFMENPLQFAGNRYHLDASIDSVLAVDDQVGRVVLVNADEDGSALPVFLPLLSQVTPAPQLSQAARDRLATARRVICNRLMSRIAAGAVLGVPSSIRNQAQDCQMRALESVVCKRPQRDHGEGAIHITPRPAGALHARRFHRPPNGLFRVQS